jgi:CAAX amino terminal protease family.
VYLYFFIFFLFLTNLICNFAVSHVVNIFIIKTLCPTRTRVYIMEETLQQKTKGPKLFKWALWWGLGIVVVCVAILMIMGESVKDFDAPMMDVFYNMIYKFGILPVVLIIGIVAPIIEEFVFRSWGNGKLWTGTTSLILMALITLSIGWWLSLITIVCGAFILYYFRDDRKTKMFSLMILSSIMFAVAHASNYNGDGHWFMMFVSVLHKFGFGLMASYLVINYNLFWSMVFHALNNSILALPLLIGFNSINNEVKVIENDDFRVEMRTVLVEDKQLDMSNKFYTNAIENTYFGNAASFAHQAMYYDVWSQRMDPNFDTLILAVNYRAFPKCHFNLSFKQEPIDYHRLLNTLVEEGLIEIDTTVKQAYKMDITDQSKLVYGQPEGLISYKMLVRLVRETIELPFYIDIPNNIYTGTSLYDSLYVKDISYTNYRSDYTIDDLRKILEPQGITIEPTDRKMTIIDIKNKYNPLEEL